MKKLTFALVSFSLLATTAVPARANDDLIRFGIGLGAAVIGEVVKNRNNKQQQATPQRQRSAPARSQAAPRAQSVKPRRIADENVRYVQQRLHDLGYTQVGGADGFWGRNTAAAVAAFMADNGMDGDPRMSDGLVSALKTAKHRDVLIAEAEAAEHEAAVDASIPPSKVGNENVHFEAPHRSEEEHAHIDRELVVAPENFVDDELEAEEEIVIDLEPKKSAEDQVVGSDPTVRSDPDVAEASATPDTEAGTVSSEAEDPEPQQVEGIIISEEF